MGDLTRDELVEEVTKNLGNRDLGNRTIRHLNMAQTRIARKHRFSELNRLDSVAITPTGTPSVDKLHTFEDTLVRSIHSLVRVISGETPVKLISKPSRQWAQLVGVSEEYASGDPTHYNEWQRGVIEFWRVPNRPFSLLRKYRVWPGVLSLPGGFSDLEDKDDIIIAFATSSLFRSLGQDADAGTHFAIARTLLDEAIIQDQEKPDESHVYEGVTESGVGVGDYVIDPFVKEAP
jgi:hypothetical protein